LKFEFQIGILTKITIFSYTRLLERVCRLKWMIVMIGIWYIISRQNLRRGAGQGRNL
jgi:hypothetical protein